MALLLHAQAFQIGPKGQEGCVNVHTELVHSGTWHVQWDECSRTCGGGVKTAQITCRDPTGTAVAEHMCRAEERPAAEEEACNTGVCHCEITPEMSFWLLKEDFILDVGKTWTAKCDPIPHYFITGQEMKWRCTDTGPVRESSCLCLTVGQLTKHDQIYFGPSNNSNQWLKVTEGELRDTEKENEQIQVYHAEVRDSDLKFEYRITIKNGSDRVLGDSIIWGVEPEECMQICLHHNQWNRQSGCEIAVPLKLISEDGSSLGSLDTFLRAKGTPDEDESLCWLRHGRTNKSRYKTREGKSPFSYDLKCMGDELSKPEQSKPEWLTPL